LLKANTKIILISILGATIFAVGCSSSSYNQRYNKPEAKDSDSKKKSVRFTSKDDDEKSEAPTTNEDEAVFKDYEAEFDEEPVEEYKIDTEEFISKYDKLNDFNITLTPREKILFEVINYLHTPYKYGGNSKQGIDCSAFTQNVFSNSLNLVLPRTARQQFNEGKSIYSKSELRFGDLVFFDTTTISFPGHVGIYLGDNLFVHASRSKGVVVSSLQSSYYKGRFVGGKRVREAIE
jgi:cell wall-associated NlpC family hydrolase